ncbi:MAG: hypothetical protein GY820_04725 [Gammaproteobacteria bacterium]|nr:hypothetical protein [Gammaproteobacteria bacterium]
MFSDSELLELIEREKRIFAKFAYPFSLEIVELALFEICPTEMANFLDAAQSAEQDVISQVDGDFDFSLYCVLDVIGFGTIRTNLTSVAWKLP